MRRQVWMLGWGLVMAAGLMATPARAEDKRREPQRCEERCDDESRRCRDICKKYAGSDNDSCSKSCVEEERRCAHQCKEASHQ